MQDKMMDAFNAQTLEDIASKTLLTELRAGIFGCRTLVVTETCGSFATFARILLSLSQ